MITLFCYTEVDEIPVFFTLHGDYSHFHLVLINSGEDKEKEQELVDLIYDTEGQFKIEKSNTLSSDTQFDVFVNCGST